MILRTKSEIAEIVRRLNSGEPSKEIYADMNSRIDVKARNYKHKNDLKKIQKRFPDLVF